MSEAGPSGPAAKPPGADRTVRRQVVRFAGATAAATVLLGGGVAVGATFKPWPWAVRYNLTVPANGDPFLANGVAYGDEVERYSSAGTGPGGLNTAAPAGTPERYVDPAQFPGGVLPDGVTATEAQGLNALARVKENLESVGLTMADITFMRIYLDNPAGAERADYNGWNRAYRKYLANVDLNTGQVIAAYEPVIVKNATRPARSNIEVATLPVAGWLVEIEVEAAYPPGRR